MLQSFISLSFQHLCRQCVRCHPYQMSLPSAGPYPLLHYHCHLHTAVVAVNSPLLPPQVINSNAIVVPEADTIVEDYDDGECRLACVGIEDRFGFLVAGWKIGGAKESGGSVKIDMADVCQTVKPTDSICTIWPLWAWGQRCVVGGRRKRLNDVSSLIRLNLNRTDGVWNYYINTSPWKAVHKGWNWSWRACSSLSGILCPRLDRFAIDHCC